jgi:tripartite-type tricarboxylate transporter receptor subunit TctC
MRRAPSIGGRIGQSGIAESLIVGMQAINRVAVLFALVALAAPMQIHAQPTSAGSAQAYPVKPIRLILPFPPSGGTDTLGRGIAQVLSAQIGQQVVADNRPGAGGNLGLELASRAPPDGYTMVLSSPLIAISPMIYAKLNYDPEKDLAPVTWIAFTRKVIVVHPSVPVRSMKELIELARRNPGKLNFGSGGVGTSVHLTVELIKSLTAVNMVHVPYKGTILALGALVAGEIDMVVASMTPVVALAQGGRLRPLAILSETRGTAMAELPTAAEAGFPQVTDDTWYGMFVPAGTPRPLVDRLNLELRKTLVSPEFVKRLDSVGVETKTSTPEELGHFVKSESARFGKVIRSAGIKPI